MIKLHIAGSLNFNTTKQFFRNLLSFDIQLTKHKVFEFEIFYDWGNIAEIQLDTAYSGYNHAGPKVALGMFGLVAQMLVYDVRHWDYETNDWGLNERS